MRAVVFTHPDFMDSTSMPLFARSIVDGLRLRGIDVTTLTPKPFFYTISCPTKLKKWLGYLDQFLVFPIVARLKTRNMPADTIFIFTDQALGPWVPGFSGRHHVVHCHDLLALRSALGEVPQNSVSLTGKIYQHWIRRGFNSAYNFICVSHRSAQELRRFLNRPESANIDVVHNGLNYPFSPLPAKTVDQLLASADLAELASGFVMHVGGNQWYKNRSGAVAIYAEYARRVGNPLPLLMIGAPPDSQIKEQLANVPTRGRVIFLIRPSSEVLHAAYARASALIFPSFAEGFGWPIIEALASGCPVLTTNDAPMTEAGGNAASYLPIFKDNPIEWSIDCAEILMSLLARSPHERERVRLAGLRHAECFREDQTIERYLNIYRGIVCEAVT